MINKPPNRKNNDAKNNMNGEIMRRPATATNIMIPLNKGYRLDRKEPIRPVTENKTIKIGITTNNVPVPTDQNVVLKQHKAPVENAKKAIGNDKISPIIPQIFSFTTILCSAPIID
jgi:hypothetical protein